jgi:hypothetical protein
MENLRVSDDVEDADTTSSDEKSPDRSYGSDGAPSPHSAQEAQLIDGARENASVVGAGAKALRGWASILGGSSAPQGSEAVAKQIGKETAIEDDDDQSDQVEASVPSSGGAPSQSAWGGWAVRNPPPKVDLKATMEADAAAAAAAPPPAAKKEKQEERQQGKNGKKAKDAKNKDAKKDVKQQRQDGNRKDKDRPTRTAINVPKVPSTKPTEVSGDRSHAPLSPEVEAKLVEKLGRELLDCAHVQYFTPTAYLLKKE